MPTTIEKPRWLHWEILCLMAAAQQKIQLKIIAFALKKSVDAVNKKIGALKRQQKALFNTQKKDVLPCPLRIPHDVAEMLTILACHAPENEARQRKQVFEKMPWAQPQPLSVPKEARDPKTLQDQAAYICGMPLTFAPYAGKAEIDGSALLPAYLSLQYVEKWAAAEGFHVMKEVLWEKGHRFWKEGKYFSRAQMVMHINKTRLAQDLPLIQLQSEEKDAQNLE